MGWKVESTQAVDERLKQKIIEKIETGTFGVEDLQDYFTLFTQVANAIDETADEVDGFDRKFQFRFEDYGNVYLTIRNRKFEMGLGEIEAPDITLQMNVGLAAGIFTGQVDAPAAYVSGALKIDGSLPDAIKFGTLVELVYAALDVSPAESPLAATRFQPSGAPAAERPSPGTPTKRVKFGVVGAGSAWGFHRAAGAGSPVLEFVAVYDKNQKHAEKVAKRYKANEMRACGSVKELLESDIDAVLIMAPHAYHTDLVLQAAAAGKHILCEKPMATTLEDCDRMIAAARDAGRQVHDRRKPPLPAGASVYSRCRGAGADRRRPAGAGL